MTAVQFAEKVTAGDAAVIGKMKNVKTPEEAYAIAEEFGMDDTRDNFKAEMSKLHKTMSTVDAKDLEAVSGGGSATDAVSAAAAVVGAAAAAL